MGHEKSADYGNGMLWLGREVNHQYDKSSDFLRRAQTYSQSVLHLETRIESALDGLFEIEIAKIFAEEESLRDFHPLFISCNEAIDVTRWCAKCAKCCFVFLIMSAWMRPPDVWAIFGENLFEKSQLLEVFLSLVGFKRENEVHKPFECVGTFEEARCAVELSLKRVREYQTEAHKCSTAALPETHVLSGCTVNNNDMLVSLVEHLGLLRTEEEDDESIVNRWLRPPLYS